MTSKHRYSGMLALLLAVGCGTGKDQTAGGQSGTDANGGMFCNYQLLEPSGEPAPLTAPLEGGLSPNDYYANIEGSYDFSCANGIHISVSIQRGDEARTTQGLSGYPENPSDDCPALQLDATVHVEASDGSLTHDASFLTARLDGGGAYTSYMLGGQPMSSSGKDVQLRLNTNYDGPNAGHITGLLFSGTAPTSIGCELAMDGGEGGHGNEPEPTWAGNSGAP